ncbi:MAG: OmpH family outer membrane protein [Candidatus Marinimicrobia bacterium]|nr:OmpH family outer membrane protein [Candidatus Neomarinimicrobiota bacterium]MDD5581587.1 OmpH family outer membrane protein [Candidatus Neomarinimicrobiota bacterium]
MKSSTIILTVALLLASTVGLQAQSKIGYINSEKILREYDEAADALAKLEAESQRMEEDFYKLQQKGQELLDEYESKRFVATEAWKTQKQQEIQKIQEELQNYQMKYFGPDGEIYAKQDEYLGPVMDKINTAIQRVGIDGGYDFIIDASKGTLVFADDKHDLTNTVLYELRKSQKK